MHNLAINNEKGLVVEISRLMGEVVPVVETPSSKVSCRKAAPRSFYHHNNPENPICSAVAHDSIPKPFTSGGMQIALEQCIDSNFNLHRFLHDFNITVAVI